MVLSGTAFVARQGCWPGESAIDESLGRTQERAGEPVLGLLNADMVEPLFAVSAWSGTLSHRQCRESDMTYMLCRNALWWNEFASFGVPAVRFEVICR